MSHTVTTILALVGLAAFTATSCSDTPADPMPEPEVDAGPDVAAQDVRGPTPCRYDIDCAGEAGTICLDGTCQVGQCRPGELFCVGDEIARCGGDADGFSITERCPPGNLCINARCSPRTCEPGEVRCVGRTRAECNDRGTGYDTLPCFGEQVCFEGRCHDPVCSPGKSLCLNDLTLGVCNEDGGGYVDQLCGFGRRCVSSQCVPFHALAFELPEARATSPGRRPDTGYVAVWLVLDRTPEDAVEVLAWASPVGAGVYARWEPAMGELVLATDRAFETSRRFAMPLELGDVVQLVIAWGGDVLMPLLDGYALAGDLTPVTPSGGTPSDTLTLGRFSAHGVALPGRLGSVWVGEGSLVEGFVPRCDAAPTDNLHAVWKLDEGTGEQAWPRDDTVAPFALDGATWTGGILGRFARDADDDGYGYDPEAQIACGPVNDDDRLRLGDCNDANAIVYPGAPEPMDRIDNDCDGQVDETE